ncbi:STAS-like domain-containing protein [Helicobacter sp.]|uniref:STAS-like domain-containing protein n=1 Tax=Helicobacter sp. TaxID=218 RepID=UPI00388F488F
MDKILEYDFAKNFSKTPGPRFKRLGAYSGEEFREILEDLLESYEFINIDGSGVVTSFSPSFLIEAFAPLAQKMGGVEKLQTKIRLFSSTNPNLESKFKAFAGLG